MPLHVHVDVGHRPDLGADELLAIVRDGLGERYEITAPGRLQVPDVMVRRSETDGVAIQILQQRLRKRTRLRVYGLAPSIARRAANPVALARQTKKLGPLLDEVVDFLEGSEALRPH